MDSSTRINVTLITGRTIEQGTGKEAGKLSTEYSEAVSVCFMDPRDMERESIKEKTPVRVSTDSGSIVLTAMKSPRAPHMGIIFIPYGPWANTIVDPETDSIGMPRLKGTRAFVEQARNERVPSLKELLTIQFGEK